MAESLIGSYLDQCKSKELSSEAIAYIASLESVAKVSPEIAKSVVQELADQRNNLKLIASENYSSLATQLAMGNLLTDKYAEGYPMHRFYAGCDNVDTIEEYACEQAKKLFNAQHAYVQPHSGSAANLIAYWSILSARVQAPILEEIGDTNLTHLSDEDWARVRKACGNQRILALDYYAGGHLTHGYRFNISAQMFDSHTYAVNKETGLMDYDAIEKQVLELKPLVLLAGYSAYPRKIDFARMRAIADKVGAVFMVDMAHFAGLVAGKVFADKYSPFPHAHIVTTTTHKTLRGPRGGMILCNDEFAEYVDKGCPMVIGGPLPHVIASKAIALTEANKPEFAAYAGKIVTNAKALASALIAEGLTVLTGGTDNHLMLVDVTPGGINGRQAESVMRECGITLNRNALPFDENGPWYTSGLRLGTPAMTTLGMGEEQMQEIASILATILKATEAAIIAKGPRAGQQSKAKYVIAPEVVLDAQKRVKALLQAYPLYPQLDLDFLQKNIG